MPLTSHDIATAHQDFQTALAELQASVATLENIIEGLEPKSVRYAVAQATLHADLLHNAYLIDKLTAQIDTVVARYSRQ